MALVQRDYILRLIESIIAAIARSRKRREEGDLNGARLEVHQATLELLGPAAAMAMMFDVRTAANLVGDAQRLRLWCQLLHEDSALLTELGRTREASAADRRIVELLLEAWHRENEWDDRSLAIFDEVCARGGADQIDAAYRALLAQCDAQRR